MQHLPKFGRSLILIGLILVGIGLVFAAFGKISWLGNLPGDISIEGDNYAFYFPLGTSLVLSVVLSLLLYLIDVVFG
jgi:hypothetical protein